MTAVHDPWPPHPLGPMLEHRPMHVMRPGGHSADSSLPASMNLTTGPSRLPPTREAKM